MSEQIIAFQGEAGAYSQQACRQHFGNDVKTIPCATFPELFQAVQAGRATHIMLPVENSLAGTVIPAYDALLDHDLRVQGEEIVKVEHCLLAPQGVSLREIKRVISHHQALSQCETTLKRMGLEAVNFYDTAGAAKYLAESREPHTGALASALSAELYHLEILSRDMQDWKHNYTRFFILGVHDAPRQEPSKTSIIFTTRHAPGALYEVLGVLTRHKLNMTKIESRPRRNIPWNYRFFVDFEGHEEDENVQQALLEILRHASSLMVLGSYPMKELPRG